VASIEVCSISAVMLHAGNNPTLVRDSLLSVVMVVLNGMVGLSLLIGAWRHREQHYNLQGANAYLGAIIPLVVLSLVLPTFTRSEGATLSFVQGAFLTVMSLGLYAAFLAIQTGRHRGYFVHDAEAEPPRPERGRRRTVTQHVLLLLAYMMTVVMLAEQMAPPMDQLVDRFHVPAAVGGLVMALLVATPEALGAVRAAAENNLQRAVNIFLGSVLATIGLTIPAMILIGDITGRAIELGVRGTDLVMLLLTLSVSVVTFASGRTNVLQGAVHLLLFAAYLMLVVAG
jgi:Ca2+:H+ antiporter